MASKQLKALRLCDYDWQKRDCVRPGDPNVLQYRENADLHAFIDPLLNAAPIFLLCSVAGLFLVGITGFLGPLLLFLGQTLLAPLKPLLTGEAHNSAAQVLSVVTRISWFVYPVMAVNVAWLTVKAAREPTHLALTRVGIAFVRKTTICASRYSSFSYDLYNPSTVLPWQQIAKVTVERPKGARSVSDYRLCFQCLNEPTLRIRYGDVIKEDDRQHLLSVLEEKFPDFVDDQLLETFKPKAPRQSYTDIWLRELSAAPKRDRLTPLSAGEQLKQGKYTVVSKLGSGGQGTVYLAEKTNSDKRELVAIKEFVLPVYPDPRVRKKAAEKFNAETDLLSKLDHRQIVKLLDVFVQDHRAYLVLKRAEGISLQDLVASEGAQPQQFVVELALQLCDILHYLHSRTPPIVHRDFTPDNLILGPDGLVLLIDFSVAQETRCNLTGSVVGKPDFIAPEQFRGKPTTQSDIYSLGATMFYLLTGQNPQPITVCRPKSLRQEIADSLDEVVARATQLECDRRYLDVEEMSHDLKQIRDQLQPTVKLPATETTS